MEDHSGFGEVRVERFKFLTVPACIQLLLAFEFFAAVEGMPLLGFGLAGGWGGGGG